MQKIKDLWRIIFFDSLAVFFIIAAVLTGWLPGPGGIPLFLIGLSLLAVNHEWANRYIILTKRHATNFSKVIFRESLRVQFDIVTVLLLVASIYLVFYIHSPIATSAAISLLFISLTIFFTNRDRYKNIKNKIKTIIGR